MSEFVITRGAQLKKNAEKNLISVVYSSTKRKEKLDSAKNNVNEKFTSKPTSMKDEKNEQEKEMKRLRWDVMKFASSSLQGKQKHEANVALAISLGAKPPKNIRKNYKILKERRQQEKQNAVEQQVQSGFTGSLKKPKMNVKKKKKDTGLLGVYGKVHKQ
ncbi:uncharacterized protein C1orf131 homolog [Chelonus insularis]|uniref:uncharacterized protein C1orf131 homolog n=1 Tax=Chelonus insularis TaxID=460826 RepID=UPI0015894E6A|nr:uncharacterized protein C1orf131 homolog [Chelonus insularis]XP_034950892.1 uncharacterized protein C1orf131 homolog [Chelonus insularis]XP_034950893.1 uncharacterized protein C1orf131 homolog [Chelonus insularis]